MHESSQVEQDHGEARRRKAGSPLVYHHTSTVYTNLIWMAGAIEVEGHHEMVPLHPHLGTVQTDLRFRRACKDFPPVAWFTTEISVPKCLILNHVILKQMDSGETVEVPISNEMANGIAMHRLALGFPVADIPVTAWPDHYGYNTPEGRELNETARDAGDEPDRWYISEGRVSLDHMSEIRIARSIQNLKMERNDGYLRDIKKLLAKMKVEKAYVPPSWMPRKDAEELARRLNLRVMPGS